MMNNSEIIKLFGKPLLIIAAVFLLLLCVSFGFIGYRIGIRDKNNDTEVRVDTLIITKHEYITEHHFDTINNVVYKQIKVPIHDTIYSVDSIDADLPYIEGHANIADTLDIWYHGWIEVGIDSARYSIFQKTEIIEKTISVPKYVTPHLMLSAGVGYAYHNKSYIFALGGLTYNMKYASLSAFGGYGMDFQKQGSPFFGTTATLRLDIKNKNKGDFKPF